MNVSVISFHCFVNETIYKVLTPEVDEKEIKIGETDSICFFSVTKLFQFPLFSDSKKCSHVAKAPPPAPALTYTTIVAMLTCTLALAQSTVDIPWPRPRTGCACYPCVFIIKNSWITSACTYKINQSKDCIFWHS